jgi:hypothetical protein
VHTNCEYWVAQFDRVAQLADRLTTRCSDVGSSYIYMLWRTLSSDRQTERCELTLQFCRAEKVGAHNSVLFGWRKGTALQL